MATWGFRKELQILREILPNGLYCLWNRRSMRPEPHSTLFHPALEARGWPPWHFRLSLVNGSEKQETEECEKGEAWVFIPLALPYWVASRQLFLSTKVHSTHQAAISTQLLSTSSGDCCFPSTQKPRHLTFPTIARPRVCTMSYWFPEILPRPL